MVLYRYLQITEVGRLDAKRVRQLEPGGEPISSLYNPHILPRAHSFLDPGHVGKGDPGRTQKRDTSNYLRNVSALCRWSTQSCCCWDSMRGFQSHAVLGRPSASTTISIPCKRQGRAHKGCFNIASCFAETRAACFPTFSARTLWDW